MNGQPILEPAQESIARDDIVLVQATSFDDWFIDLLDDLPVAWQPIHGDRKCILFIIPSDQLHWLMMLFSDVQIDILS